MRFLEEQVINILLESDIQDYDTQCKNQEVLQEVLQKLLHEEPFGISSSKFRNHPDLNYHFENASRDEQNYFMLWLSIEEYINHRDIVDSTQVHLNRIEEALKKCLGTVSPEAKAQGTSLLPLDIANAQFMRRLYSLRDENLNNLFLKYFPRPRANVFKWQNTPEIILKQEQDSTKTIINLLKSNKNDLSYVENTVVKIQRNIRARIRKEENLHRLPYHYRTLWQKSDKSTSSAEGQVFAKKLLADANTPYHPRCEEKLAIRIMEAAKKIELFSTVRHLTVASALESIFNDGLYGRRNMIELYMPFRRAALFPSDVDHGDANVVCLGANEIDPQAKHGIELQFDTKKILWNNPCVFYKQRDLGYDPDRIRNVRIGALDLYFSHTSTYRGQPPEVSSLVLCDSHGKENYALSNVTKALLIADNTKDIHQILTLNFFRFVDRLMYLDFSEPSSYKQAIYAELDKLTDDELVKTLLQIGKNMTDTMEFNFYGAYAIDFFALLTIKKEQPFYALSLPAFAYELKAGNLEKLTEVMAELPEIFNSYRFIDFLLSITNDKSVVAELMQQRSKCRQPCWMEDINPPELLNIF
ncbi:hypothetical protein [Legionella sainthelensi]|uniref:Uncharacterized protein n=1 Tax=Legionella sainthelensi TaxID=28087 RepID=A0A2H5FLZ6_9GAMM|nr:hypothetical protein [Legionella sainthelensi]AUH72562.1 hypothetical protein CAB17_11190 [Legionella sainthelensi]